MSILIIGGTQDPHIESVVRLLRERSRAVLFDPRSENSHVSLHYSGRSFHGSIGLANDRIDLSSISMVWWRLKPTFGFTGGPSLAPGEQDFRENEWGSVYKSLPQILGRAIWVNDRAAQLRIANKPEQLRRVQDLGWSVPKTLICNQPDEALKLIQSGDFVYKTLSNFVFPDSKYIFTSKVSVEDIREGDTAIRVAPCIFQERIDKKFELRVTVVNDRLFSVRIDSQLADQTSLDWRRDQLRGMYSQYELDRELQEKLITLTHDLGLVYAAYDLIVNKNEEVVFLECNPAGQWLWLEEYTGLPISQTLADLFVQHAESVR